MTRFRPCIDLHEGRVKQIVGGTLTDGASTLQTNFISSRPASDYAKIYRDDDLRGGHVILLGPGNEEAARSALAAYPGGLQIGGGIRPGNALEWLQAGASHVIVTSFLFDGPEFRPEKLHELSALTGADRLVVDLSCRHRAGSWFVATNRWQTVTDYEITPAHLSAIAPFCAELLVHAADVEGQCGGVDLDLVQLLGAWAEIPVTYAGGARSIEDLRAVEEQSGGRVDLTIGSALDLFGGSGITYRECLAWNQRKEPSP